MKKKVIVAGLVCLDITPVFLQNLSGSLTELLAPGKLTEMDGVSIHTGGAVSNTGLVMKKLGVDVRLVGKTGTDSFGKIIRDIFAQQGAAEGIIAAEGERTSYTVVIAPPGVDRSFLHDPGCNHTFSFLDIPEEMLEDVMLFHFGYPPLLKKFYQNNGEELIRMMKELKRRGIMTSLDLAMVDEGSEAGKQDWKKILTEVLPYTDFFVPSIEELCWMLDRQRYEEWKQRAAGGDMVMVLDPQRDIRPIAEQCIEMGAKVLLLKCGTPGLYYRTAGGQELKEIARAVGFDAQEWAGREGFEESYVPERVLSATGAGDTTIAAFLAAVLQGYPFEMCIKLAAAEGACCVAAYDSLSGIRSLRELEKKINSGWEKQHFAR